MLSRERLFTGGEKDTFCVGLCYNVSWNQYGGFGEGQTLCANFQTFSLRAIFLLARDTLAKIWRVGGSNSDKKSR